MIVDLNNEEMEIITRSLVERPWQEVEPLMHKFADIANKEKEKNGDKVK